MVEMMVASMAEKKVDTKDYSRDLWLADRWDDRRAVLRAVLRVALLVASRAV